MTPDIMCKCWDIPGPDIVGNVRTNVSVLTLCVMLGQSTSPDIRTEHITSQDVM